MGQNSFDERLSSSLEGYKPSSFIGQFIIFFFWVWNYPPIWLGDSLRGVLPFTWRIMNDSDSHCKARRLYIQQKGKDGYTNPRIRASAWTPSYSTGIEYHHGGEDREIGISVGIAWVRLSISIEQILNGFCEDSMRYGICIHDDGIWFYWRTGNNDMPICFRYLDFLLGETRYSSEAILQSFDPVTIPCDPAVYPATIAIHRDTWKRPRSPFTEVVYRAHCKFPGGIPCGYKWGEPDATFGFTFPAESIGAAINYIQKSTLQDRAKEGWEPLSGKGG
jgi:hypothetical protein